MIQQIARHLLGYLFLPTHSLDYKVYLCACIFWAVGLTVALIIFWCAGISPRILFLIILVAAFVQYQQVYQKHFLNQGGKAPHLASEKLLKGANNTVRLMTFNIRTMQPREFNPENNWEPSRKLRLRQVLVDQRPDVLCIQECTKTQVMYI